MKLISEANQNLNRLTQVLQNFDERTVDRISIEEYVQAIGNVTGPKSVKYISRISHGKICIYLDRKDTVTPITSIHNLITINNTIIDIGSILVPV